MAAIAGALLGARWGVSAIPQEWLQPLHGWPGLTGHEISALAHRIATRSGDDWSVVDRVDYAGWGGEDAYAEHPLLSGVFIGGAAALDTLADDVDAVVSLCRVGRRQVPEGVERYVVRLIDQDDEHNPNLDHVIDDAARTILRLREQGKTVYLHCVAAQSRTPTVAVRAAVLAGHPLDEAMAAVTGALPAVNPRRSFREALARLSEHDEEKEVAR